MTDLCQPSSNAVPVIPFENDKFKPDDTNKFSIGMGGMGKAKKDNVLKPNGIPGPGQYRIKGFAEVLAEKGRKISEVKDKIRKRERERELEIRKKEEEEISRNPAATIGFSVGLPDENNFLNGVAL